ncbi:MAG: glycosyltransferase [Desulfobacteraceae bacterium]|nr:MAG: glycosyltransferase [Desulfobacteraceae bacterium]
MILTVCMTTYNQEKFIAQAIESVLGQQPDFDFELLIGDDASRDRTPEIITDYATRFPRRIRPLLHSKNLGFHRNLANLLTQCHADYIALLEGDDYWTDPHKLDKQFDLLRRHPEFSACFCRARVLYEGDPTRLSFIPADSPNKSSFTTEELLRKNYIPTGTLVFRNYGGAIDLRPFFHLSMIDRPLEVLVSLRGPIGYINDVTAVYRRHDDGVWGNRDEVWKLKEEAKFFFAIVSALPYHLQLIARQQLAKTYQMVAARLIQRQEYRKALGFVIKSLAALPRRQLFRSAWYLKRSLCLMANAIFKLKLGWE